ncbi:MAG: D-glycero-beta-D-manno-heptose 1,7-bisphosphate 7-phosphatase [Gammaproteobacteria bacterium]
MKLIILDRDGVINHDSDDYIKSVDEWLPVPGSLEAIARLYQDGYRILVASNQAGLALGKFNIEALNTIHQNMLSRLSQYGGTIEAIFFCPHAPDGGCECRKPKPGLFNEIARRVRISLEGITSVGDKLSDIEAAKASGASPVLVKTGRGEALVNAGKVPGDVPVFNDLSEVVDALLATD